MSKFRFEGQCYTCGLHSGETNVHNQCRNCAGPPDNEPEEQPGD